MAFGARLLADLNGDLEDALRPDRLPAPPPPPRAAPPPPSPHAGALLRSYREQRGVSLRELSLRTKIPLAQLEVLEAFDRPNLPKPAWLRGYLRELAQVLQLDEASLLNLYMGQL
jgi:cytoskeleton protein RodZ